MRIKRYAPSRLSRRVKIETLQTAGIPAVLYSESAGMMELVDMRDLGSRASGVGVRVPMPAPTQKRSFWHETLRSKLSQPDGSFFRFNRKAGTAAFRLFILLAPTFLQKSQSALIPLLLLSKSNPLCWVSIWVQRTFSINTRHLDNVPFGTKPCAASFLSRTERFFIPTGKPARLLSGCFFACSAAPPKNKKCVSPKPSGLTHFCYTIFLSNFLPFFHISPDSIKRAHGNSATGFTQNRHTLWAYYSGFTEKFQMVLFTNFTCRTPLNT